MFVMNRHAKVSTVTPSSDLLLRGQRSKRSIFKIISNYKNNSTNMFVMNRHAKVSTVTPSSDLLLRGQRSKRSIFKIISNCKNNSANMFVMNRHAKKKKKIRKICFLQDADMRLVLSFHGSSSSSSSSSSFWQTNTFGHVPQS